MDDDCDCDGCDSNDCCNDSNHDCCPDNCDCCKCSPDLTNCCPDNCDCCKCCPDFSKCCSDSAANTNNSNETYLFFCIDTTEDCNPCCCWDYERRKKNNRRAPNTGNISAFKSNTTPKFSSQANVGAPNAEQEMQRNENKPNTLTVT